MVRCPKCLSRDGLYVATTLTNVKKLYDFDGNVTDRDLSEAIETDQKKVYCRACNEYLFKFEEFMQYKDCREFSDEGILENMRV